MGEECLVWSCALFLLCTTIWWRMYCFVSILKPTLLGTGWILRCLSRNLELCANIQCHCVWKSRSACLINLDMSLVLPCIRLERPFWKIHVCSIGCVSRQKEAKRELFLLWPGGARVQFGTGRGFSGVPFQAHSALYSLAGPLLPSVWMPFVGAGECVCVEWPSWQQDSM